MKVLKDIKNKLHKSISIFNRFVRFSFLVTTGLLFVCIIGFPRNSCATSYYVDSIAGSDPNPGTAETTPWKTVHRVNKQRFSAGDVLLFKRGCEWFDVSINVDSPDLTIGAFGTGAAPRLVGSIKVADWKDRGNGVYYTYFPRPPNRKQWTNWEVLLVMEAGNRFYKKVESLDGLIEGGRFYYNKQNQNLYIKPLDPFLPVSKTLYVGRQDNIIEIMSAHIDRLVVRDLEISLANRYGIGPWWQGDKITQGSVLIERNTFLGNAFSAVCLSGFMSYDQITIRNNVIRMSGAEGIYIGKYATRTSLEIADNSIGDPADPSFGWAGAGPASAFNGDGIDIKKGNHGAVITRNIIRHITSGGCGICSHSSALIIDNIIEDVRLPWTFSAGIFVDIDDLFGLTTITRNRIAMSEGHGISVRGNLTLHPPLTVEGNDIVLRPNSPYSNISFQLMNSQQIKIISNRFTGGAYGLSFPSPYPPVDYVVRDNSFSNLSKSLFYFSQSGIADLKSLSVESNQVCTSIPAYIEWQSGLKVKDVEDVSKIFGAKSIIETKCQ